MSFIFIGMAFFGLGVIFGMVVGNIRGYVRGRKWGIIDGRMMEREEMLNRRAWSTSQQHYSGSNTL